MSKAFRAEAYISVTGTVAVLKHHPDAFFDYKIVFLKPEGQYDEAVTLHVTTREEALNAFHYSLRAIFSGADTVDVRTDLTNLQYTGNTHPWA